MHFGGTGIQGASDSINAMLDASKHFLEHALNVITFQLVRSKGRAFTREIAIHSLAVKPEQIDEDTIPRTAVTETLGGVFADMFGHGLKTVTVSGTTGYMGRRVGLSMKTGLEQIQHLYDDIYENSLIHECDLKSGALGGLLGLFGVGDTDRQGFPWLYYYNWKKQQYWRIVFIHFKINEAVARNRLYTYTMQFIKISDIEDEIYSIDDPAFSALVAAKKGRVFDGINAGFDALSLVAGALDLAADMASMFKGDFGSITE